MGYSEWRTAQSSFATSLGFQIGANYKIFPQVLRSGRNWFADTKGPSRAERRPAALDEDIKTAALKALVPSELEQHLAMNRARPITHEQVRIEIQAYIEALQSQFEFKTVAAKSTSDPMDVEQAISAFPLDAKIGTETQTNECSYKAASSERNSDRGGLRVQENDSVWVQSYFPRHKKNRRPQNSDQRGQNFTVRAMLQL